MDHNPDTCMELDCDACFPEYIPAVNDYVRDSLGNTWRVMSIGDWFISLLHATEGHYASVPKGENGAFRFGNHVKVTAP